MRNLGLLLRELGGLPPHGDELLRSVFVCVIRAKEDPSAQDRLCSIEQVNPPLAVWFYR